VSLFKYSHINYKEISLVFYCEIKLICVTEIYADECMRKERMAESEDLEIKMDHKGN
jgi:hypothetical protein